MADADAADDDRSPEPIDGASRTGAARAAREVFDPATGRRWRVWAAATAHVPGAPAGDCLVFDAGEVIRRVWGAPPDWRALSDAALLTLVEARPGRPHGSRVADRAD